MAHIRRDVLFIVGLVGLLWVIFLTHDLFGLLAYCGVIPRHYYGVIGFVVASCSPFVHGNLFHLAANTLPLAILGLAVIQYGRTTFVRLTLFVIVVSVVGVWLFGTLGRHIGVSGLLFGYFGFIIVSGTMRRSVKAIVLALGVLILYWPIVFSVFPTTAGVSWESHLFGLVGGIAYAIWTRKRKQ